MKLNLIKALLPLLFLSQLSLADGVVNFYNWADYIGESTIKDFEEEPELYGKTIGFKVFKAALPAVTDNRSFMKKAGNFFKGRGFKQ